jgi:Leucine Rich repeat
LVHLNLASNDISNEGMIAIFKGLTDNESVISLNLSTVDGVARNHISQSGIQELKKFLNTTNFLEILDLSSIGLGNEGLVAICETLSVCKKEY